MVVFVEGNGPLMELGLYQSIGMQLFVKSAVFFN